MEWYVLTFWWYGVLSLIGILFLPFTRLLFHKFFDQGYAFSRVIGVVAVSYAVFILGSLKIVPFTSLGLLLVLIAAGVFNFFIFRKTKKDFAIRKIWILEEIIFLISLFVWAYVRGQEPSIRGLEKFMDFGFINSALRGDFFPPKDMWLAGKTINYYYFGHIIGAVITKISHIPSYISYNLILATIFACGIVETFSIGLNLAYVGFKKNIKLALITAVLATFLVNLGGNLHTAYSLTKGYPNEKPQPIWELELKYSLKDLKTPLASINRLSENYWYPNATRFIPYTIHEFPLYSYVVADLHGHVFDIPIVLLTLAVLILFYLFRPRRKALFSIGFGFLCAIHYMTNAFDAPIYLLLTMLFYFVTYRISKEFLVQGALLVGSFILFSLPFTLNFEPFATGIGINCAPAFLTDMKKFGPLIFEAGNCQVSQWWMLVTLWGFFWFNFIFFSMKILPTLKKSLHGSDYFVLMLFSFGTLLIAIPEFAYAKDIYPAHFRANTMFKLGYQAFMVMSIASAYVFVSFKQQILKKRTKLAIVYFAIGIPIYLLVALYPTFAINSYYGGKKTTSLEGNIWVQNIYTEYAEIINYFNSSVKGQPFILEAQGDSYTDYNIVSAYTGLPTVGGWWVHEWLWRGSSSVIGNIIPDIQNMYQSKNIAETRKLLKKYSVAYVVVGPHEKEKYKQLYQSKFEALGQPIFTTTSGASTVYKITLDR